MHPLMKGAEKTLRLQAIHVKKSATERKSALRRASSSMRNQTP
jgi:hypothetical protein